MYKHLIGRGRAASRTFPTSSSGSESFELRASTRFDCNIRATAYANYVNFFCIVTNVSLGGAALFEKGFGELHTGDNVRLMIHSLDALSGEIRWVGQSGFGIEFSEASRHSEGLAELIEGLAKEAIDKGVH